jgi:hypothetical protein
MALTKEQRRNGLEIVRETCVRGHHRGWDYWRTRQCARIALMVAMTEANLSMYASANVPESQKFPHQPVPWTSDGLGHDHASMNMFQQQTGYKWTPANHGVAVTNATMEQSTMDSPDGWGPPSELMDPKIATRKFLHALSEQFWHGVEADTFVKHQPSSLGERAQLVQGSAFPDRYQTQYRRAGRFLRRNLRFFRIWRATKPAVTVSPSVT